MYFSYILVPVLIFLTKTFHFSISHEKAPRNPVLWLLYVFPTARRTRMPPALGGFRPFLSTKILTFEIFKIFFKKLIDKFIRML